MRTRPTRRTQLTPTQRAALAQVRAHGGIIERHPGGYWSYQGCPIWAHSGEPHWHVGTPTIEALVLRGILQYDEWRAHSRGAGRFPVRAKLTALGEGKEEAAA